MGLELCVWRIAAVLGLLLPPLLTRWQPLSSQRASASRDDALESVKLMKDWGVWLTGIQTAAIAAIGAFFRGDQLPPAAQIAVLFFTASIIVDTVLLAGLPSIVLRLKRSEAKDGTSGDTGAALSPDNDIYELTLFASSVYGKRTGAMYIVSHIYFVLGISAFAMAFALCASPAAR